MSALKHALRSGRIVRLRRGVYAEASAAEHLSTAVTLTVPRAVVSDRSAALQHGLPVVGGLPTDVEITVPPRASTNIAGAHPYRARLRPQDIVQIDDRPVTSPARTVVDVARHWPWRTSVPAIDAALFGGLTSLEEIADVLHFCAGWPGIGRAKRAVALSDGRAESPLESISRLVIPRLGFPRPEPQRWILDQYGRPIARCDFSWDELGVVGEADGRGKYGQADAYPLEKERQERLEDLGLVVVRWGWRHAWSQHEILRRKIGNGVQRALLRDRSGFPRLWTLGPST